MRNFRIIVLATVLLLLIGCHTYIFEVKPGELSKPLDKRNGFLALKVMDRRDDKSKIGEARGGWGNKVGDIGTKGDLSTLLEQNFENTLEKAGYKVVPDANVTLEVEIREFVLYGGGFTRSARESVRLRLRDKTSKILWEQALKEGDNGMLNGMSSYQKSMNAALTRLLQDSLDEFTSDFFYQTVMENSKN